MSTSRKWLKFKNSINVHWIKEYIWDNNSCKSATTAPSLPKRKSQIRLSKKKEEEQHNAGLNMEVKNRNCFMTSCSNKTCFTVDALCLLLEEDG
ncbi:hypothetical protein CEXT_635841, partial [Caerostris extrusa]